jgi:hypothetical protein
MDCRYSSARPFGFLAGEGENEGVLKGAQNMKLLLFHLASVTFGLGASRNRVQSSTAWKRHTLAAEANLRTRNKGTIRALKGATSIPSYS